MIELGQAAYGLAFSPDGKFLAACGNGLTVWRVTEGKKGTGNAPRLSFERMAHLPGHRSLYLCISPDSQLLAWVDHNYLVCLWDLANGREIPFLGPALSSAGTTSPSIQTATTLRLAPQGAGRDLGHTHRAEGVHPGGRGRRRCQPGRPVVCHRHGIRDRYPVEFPNGFARVLAPAGKRPDLDVGREPGRRAPGRRPGRRRAGDLERAQDPGPTQPDRPGVACGYPPAAAARNPSLSCPQRPSSGRTR